MDEARDFRGLVVGGFTYQSKKERFGREPPPDHATWRMNLTALSQRYNLYFAAYRDIVHVTVPRSLKQTLPPKPDLKIVLPRSRKGVIVGGYIDSDNPHSVNHMILGNLGNYEVLLMACDDGDVIAYYTHLLENEVNQSRAVQSGLDNNTAPLFHENVGKSAWGLALHEHSRLIAVSSNRREITIFALAIDSGIDDENVSEDGSISEMGERGSPLPTNCIQDELPLLSSPPSSAREYRQHGYRLLLDLGQLGHNVPSICFSSSRDFEAESVFATDIRGNLWSFNIWGRINSVAQVQTSPGPLHYPGMRTLSAHGDHMGWGVLILPLKDFKLESTLHEALGTRRPAGFNNNYPELDVCSVTHPFDEGLLESPNQLASHDLQCLVNYMEDLLGPQSSLDRHSSPDGMKHTADDTSSVAFSPENVSSPEAAAVFRTYEFSADLVSWHDALPNISCDEIMSNREPEFDLNPQIEVYNRLNMLARIPELSLVVAASQMGLVALFTLTKLEDGFSKLGPVVFCRLDAILPLEEHTNLLTAENPLLGIAVSPLPSSERWDARKNLRPRRWRLIITYFDSSVVSYELSRKENDELLII